MYKKGLLASTFILGVFFLNAKTRTDIQSDTGKISAVSALQRGNQYYGEKKYEEAVKWYQQAANDGNAEGMTNLGSMYSNGWGVMADNSAAAKWYLKAAESGSAKAMLYLGIIYQNGSGVNKSLTEAFNWYTKAANAGNAEGMFKLAEMYENGIGVDKNLTQALKWYKTAAGRFLMK
jgi:TPR repeat protein